MSFLRSSAMMVMAVMGSNILAYAFHMIAGRYLGPAGYGQFGVLISLFTLLAIPYNGLTLALTKAIGKSNQYADFSQNAIVLAFSRIGLKTIFLFGSSLVIAFLFFYDRLKINENTSFIILFALFAFSTFHGLVAGQIRADREFKKLSSFQLLEAIARLAALGMLVLVLHPNASGVLLAFSFGFVIPSFFYRKYLWRLFQFKSAPEQDFIPKPVRNKWVVYSAVISLKNLILIGITNFSVIFVNQWLNSEEVGYWNAALTIARINQFSATAIAAVLFAEASNTNEKMSQIGFAKKASLYFGLMSIAVVAAFFIVPHWLIIPLYGKTFSPAQEYLPWIGIGTAVLGFIQIWADFYLARLNIDSFGTKTS